MTTFERERERRKRLLAATTVAADFAYPATPRPAARAMQRHRHVDLVARMIHDPAAAILSLPKGRRAITIRRGGHVRHGDCA